MNKETIVDPEKIHFKTDRLILRPLDEEDSESIYRNVKEYDIARWTIKIPHPYPQDGAIKFIKESKENLQNGHEFQLAILLKDTSELVGVMSFLNVNRDHKHAELGYWVGKGFWNQGIATEAAKRIMEIGFHELDMERIYAKCFYNNDASRRVLEKIGMEYEGRFRSEILKENEFKDMIYYAAIKGEWDNHG